MIEYAQPKGTFNSYHNIWFFIFKFITAIAASLHLHHGKTSNMYWRSPGR